MLHPGPGVGVSVDAVTGDEGDLVLGVLGHLVHGAAVHGEDDAGGDRSEEHELWVRSGDARKVPPGPVPPTAGSARGGGASAPNLDNGGDRHPPHVSR